LNVEVSTNCDYVLQGKLQSVAVYIDLIQVRHKLKFYHSVINLAFTEPNYKILAQDFEEVTDWKTLAVFLLDDDNGSKAEQIEKTYCRDVTECRLKMISEYLKSGDVSWEKVLDSLRKAKYENLASKIEERLGVL